MEHKEILDLILDKKIIAIIRLESSDRLIKIAESLMDGGINIIEFTVPTPNSIEMINQACNHFDDQVIIGAGTVLDPETARVAILAGAQFIVTPTLNLEVIKLCHRYGKPVIPGALTPTEILSAWEAGADVIKVFPVSLGGPEYIRAIKAPLPQVRIAAVGGVSSNNAAEYLRAGAVALGVGGKLVDKDAIEREDWASLTLEARKLVTIVTH